MTGNPLSQEDIELVNNQNGIIDHNPCHHDDAHHREDIEALPCQSQGPECSDQPQRHGDQNEEGAFE